MSASVRSPLPSNRRVSTPPRANAPVREQKPWDPDALWRQVRLAGRIVAIVAIVAIGVAAAVYARRYVTQSPRFALKDLKVDGHRHRTREHVLELSGIAIGQNVVELDLEAARARIDSSAAQWPCSAVAVSA